MNNLWINKYYPTNLSSIIGHKVQINKISDIINNSLNNTLIISGPNGIGKTLTVKLLLEKYDYVIKIINPNDIKSCRLLNDFEDYYNYQNSVLSKVNTLKKSNKIAIIFNEIENISLTAERKYIMDIFKENNKKKKFPLFFISNNQHSKLLNDLKKNCVEIQFSSPTMEEMKGLISMILANESLIILNDDNLFERIINFAQFDIKRLINILQELSFHYNEITNMSQLELFFEKTYQKNINISLYDATCKILNNYNDYDTTMKIYETEKVLLPLMIHEHYLKKILAQNKNDDWNEVLYSLVKTSDSISRGDNIETSIYTDQNWYLQNIHGFYTCVNTSYWINKVNNNFKLSNNNMSFSADLNKTSLKNINKKNINNLIKIISNKSIDEIIFLSQLSNFLIKNNNQSILIETLKKYKKNISVKDLELCLKINKTIDFIKLSCKERKQIAKKYNINIQNT